MQQDTNHGLSVVTADELLRGLGREKDWLRDQIKAGVIPRPRRLGRLRLWLRTELDEFFASLPHEEPANPTETEAA